LLNEVLFCKLGGSVITDKRYASTAQPQVLTRLAREIAQALDQVPGMGLLLGHGSGSFGHVVAAKYGVHQGLAPGSEWWGYAETSAAAARLNQIVTDTLIEANVPAVSIQPSASARCRSGTLEWIDTQPIREALYRKLVPLLYGDVAFDADQGCTILSTEALFSYLAPRLRPARIIMVGQVDGVYDRDPLADPTAQRIDRITPHSFPEIQAQLGRSHGVDVTGGMLDKVKEMVNLVADGHTRRVHLISGQKEGALLQALLDSERAAGTLIEQDSS
jgi:isopentenyl phosphate kinase